MHQATGANPIRLDKWLWAARFFKSRALASAAIKGGKVEVNGHRPKPATHIRPGDDLAIQRGPFEYRVTVERGITRRGPPEEAATLYTESPDSAARRAALTADLKAAAALHPRAPARPSKRDRRRIIRFTRRPES
ncbi:MAG: RNA-binding S4 domain-containing protein [Gammaproteobacteria bacterium]